MIKYSTHSLEEINADQKWFVCISKLSIDLACLELFSKYYSAYYENDFKDLSFAVSDGNVIVAFVLCYKINNKLSLPSGGVEMFFREKECNKKLVNFIFNQIEFTASKNNCSDIFIRDELRLEHSSSLSEILLLERYHGKITFNMKIDYNNFSEHLYFSTIRKSYKSFINWGKKNLELKFVNNLNMNRDLFDDFKNFHHHISGRKTRSDLTWAIQFFMLEAGIAELNLAYFNNELVAGSFFADNGIQSIYFSGVYNRDLFSKGISHYLTYNGIIQSKNRGKTKFFNLGDFDTEIEDDKHFNIQFFKKGFCKDLNPQIIWSRKIGK